MRFRILLSVVLLLLASYALYFFCWVPYQCNLQEKRVQRLSEILVQSPSGIQTGQLVRRNLAVLEKCIHISPADVDLYMIAGVNYRLVNRSGEAIEMYKTALHYDRRPEIYLQLGLTQLEAGRRDEAFHNLVTASRFDVYNIWRIPDLAMSDQVFRAVNPKPAGAS